MRRPGPRAAEAAALVLVLVAAAVLLSARFETAANYDEGVYLASVDALREGQELGSEVFTSQPPGTYYLLTALAGPAGRSVDGFRAGILVLSLIGIAAAHVTGRALGGPFGGIGAAAVLAVAPPFPTEAARISADAPATALALVAIAFAAVASRRAAHWPAFWAGAALAAAVSVKLLVLTALVPVGILVARSGERKRAIVAAVAGSVVVAAVVTAPVLGSLPDLWENVVEFHTEARALEGPGIPENLERVLLAFEPRTPFAWLLGLALASTAAGGFVSARKLLPLWLWGVASAAFLVWQRPLFDHHLILLAASLAVPAGAALGAAVARAPRRTKLALAAATVLLVSAGYVQETRRLADNAEPEDPSLLAAAAALEERTPADSLVVTDLPLVGFLADRRLPGNLVDASSVRIRTGSLGPNDITRAASDPRVAAAVVGREFRRLPAVVAALRRRFSESARFGEITLLWGRAEGS